MFHDQLSLYRSYSREETRDGEQLNCNGTKENQTESTQVIVQLWELISDNLKQNTCLPNQNDVFWIGQKVRPVFFNTGQPIGSGDMCPQIKSIYFLVLLAYKWAKKDQKWA